MISVYLPLSLSLSWSKRPSLPGRARHTVAPYAPPQLRARSFALHCFVVSPLRGFPPYQRDRRVGNPPLLCAYPPESAGFSSFFGYVRRTPFTRVNSSPRGIGGEKGAGGGERERLAFFRPFDARTLGVRWKGREARVRSDLFSDFDPREDPASSRRLLGCRLCFASGGHLFVFIELPVDGIFIRKYDRIVTILFFGRRDSRIKLQLCRTRSNRYDDGFKYSANDGSSFFELL